MVMHNILEYTGLLARGMAADGWLCDCEGRSIPAMEYSESCAILLLCLLLPLGPLHVLLEGVVDHEQLLAGVVDHVVQLLQGVVDHGQLLAGVVDHIQLLGGVVDQRTAAGWGCRPRTAARRGSTPRTAVGLFVETDLILSPPLPPTLPETQRQSSRHDGFCWVGQGGLLHGQFYRWICLRLLEFCLKYQHFEHCQQIVEY